MSQKKIKQYIFSRGVYGEAGGLFVNIECLHSAVVRLFFSVCLEVRGTRVESEQAKRQSAAKQFYLRVAGSFLPLCMDCIALTLLSISCCLFP